MLGQVFTYFPPPSIFRKLLEEGSFSGLPFFERGLLFIKGTGFFFFLFFLWRRSAKPPPPKKKAPRLLNDVTFFSFFALVFTRGGWLLRELAFDSLNRVWERDYSLVKIILHDVSRYLCAYAANCAYIMLFITSGAPRRKAWESQPASGRWRDGT